MSPAIALCPQNAAKGKYGFKLYALCIMSNHVHYLLEPAQPEDLPQIMHWLNWYTAMCFNRSAEPQRPLLGEALPQHRFP
jgi:REP element-mobilizing transposase RayT